MEVEKQLLKGRREMKCARVRGGPDGQGMDLCHSG